MNRILLPIIVVIIRGVLLVSLVEDTGGYPVPSPQMQNLSSWPITGTLGNFCVANRCSNNCPRKPTSLTVKQFIYDGRPGLNITWKLPQDDSFYNVDGFYLLILAQSNLDQKCVIYKFPPGKKWQDGDSNKVLFVSEIRDSFVQEGHKYEVFVRSLPWLGNEQASQSYRVQKPTCVWPDLTQSCKTNTEPDYGDLAPTCDDNGEWTGGPLQCKYVKPYNWRVEVEMPDPCCGPKFNASIILAPPEYGFNVYRVMLTTDSHFYDTVMYKSIDVSENDGLKAEVQFKTENLTGPFVIRVRPDAYGGNIDRDMENCVCLSTEGFPECECITSKGPLFTIIAAS